MYFNGYSERLISKGGIRSAAGYRRLQEQMDNFPEERLLRNKGGKVEPCKGSLSGA
jgi:hypothetical protein